MQCDCVSFLGVQLDDVASSAFVRSLQERPETELIEDRLYMELPEFGIAFIAGMDGMVTAIHCYAEGFQGSQQYSGPLPDGLSFSDSRSDVHEKLGIPSASSGGGVIPLLGECPAWDRFDRRNYSLHLQYSGGEKSIALVTVMRPDSVPL